MKKPLLALLFPFLLFGQNNDAACEILFKINTLLQKEHVHPKPINDSLSAYVFDHLMDDLDPSRNIFLKSQYDILSHQYRFNLDNLILKKDCSFMTKIRSIYKDNLLRNKIILEKLKNDSIDFSQKDTIRFSKKNFDFYLNENEVANVWNKKIRFEILNDISEKSKNLDSIKDNYKSLIAEAKKSIIENEFCKIDAFTTNEKLFADNVFDIFCSYFDPHTNYFSNDTKSNFVAALSSQHLSLGLDISLNEKNEIIVNEINPNGSAFKTGKIKKGDQIICVSNQKEILKVSCSSLESISNLLASETNTRITLTLRRNSGKSFEVFIEKKMLNEQENTVCGFMITKKNKIGYIKIPSFYSDFDGESDKGCTHDVTKEIVKLQKDNINGLVIDLTDNGGGSIEEAAKLSGLFIGEGPISIIQDNKKQIAVINNPVREVIYKGPLVIIINGNSASASEFFAATMQDYNRAILIGSTSLGKATMQTILPLKKNDKQHFVKVTINKFYRITGKSNQSLGVIPDVQMPIIYQDVFQKESEFPTALKNDSLSTSIQFKSYIENSVMNELAQKSIKRITENPYFMAVKTVNSKIDLMINQSEIEIPLTIDAVFENQNKTDSLADEINKFDSEILNLKVSNSAYNDYLLTVYPSQKEYNKLQIDALKNNHYLNEAIMIIEDLQKVRG